MVVDPGTDLSVQPVGGGVVKVVGELDIRTCERLELVAGELVDGELLDGELVDGELLDGCRTIVLDLSELTFCDSTGLAGLVRLHKRARAAGGSLVLRAPVQRLRKLLTVTGLVRLFVVEP
jgi:anti-anti-sigma factor